MEEQPIIEPSNRFELNTVDGKKIAKALFWSLLSSAIAFVIATLPMIDFPKEYAFIITAIVPSVTLMLQTAYRYCLDKGKLF